MRARCTPNPRKERRNAGREPEHRSRAHLARLAPIHPRLRLRHRAEQHTEAIPHTEAGERTEPGTGASNPTERSSEAGAEGAADLPHRGNTPARATPSAPGSRSRDHRTAPPHRARLLRHPSRESAPSAGSDGRQPRVGRKPSRAKPNGAKPSTPNAERLAP